MWIVQVWNIHACTISSVLSHVYYTRTDACGSSGLDMYNWSGHH